MENLKVTKLGPPFLTVVIRDDSPLVCAGDRPAYRTVQIELTENQRKECRLFSTYTVGGKDFFEQISQTILEGE